MSVASPGGTDLGARRGVPARAVGALMLLALLCACTSATPVTPDASSASPSTLPSGAVTAGPSTGAPGPAPTGTQTPEPSGTVGPSGADAACVERTVAAMTPPQRLGQLFMVGLQRGQAPGGLDTAITSQHLGAVIYLGGWPSGAAKLAQVSAHLQQVAAGPVDLLIAADQEGGAVQQLTGPGFSVLPSAVQQGRDTSAKLTRRASGIGQQLRAAGVNVDLAPVADTVPPSLTTRNQPIGRWGRHYGTDPAVVATKVPAVVTGLQAQQVVATLKHFPGLGRIVGNTDLTATDITDTLTTVDDPYLEPFRAGIAAGAGMVMVSSARYPALDPKNQAVFSRAVITDLLRGRLGWQGVVVTDDVGAAQAVAAVPVGERAVRFLEAGGDIVLTASASQLPTMLAAVRARAAGDPAFAATLDAATHRVVGLKVRFGLVRCG